MQSEGALVNTAASDSSERSKNKLDQKVISIDFKSQFYSANIIIFLF